ncbi:hypothetical protein L484_000216 [Morus notabilis]|uniref:Uncharacterized protein n=1 Tax=Morus notabilis TaxID=981085 RepID=W9T3B3_9ROSA|nr:hypothetical protein L484_003419 [Morus notabilis]EXC72413.1 hypothetical protein L484_000216 [Morus notabilis]
MGLFTGLIFRMIHCISKLMNSSREMPMPILLDNQRENYSRSFWEFRYFGESGDRLHVIYCKNESGETDPFNVYEMKRDNFGWFIKYRVDLSDVSAAFPVIIPPRYSTRLILKECSFSVLCVVLSEHDEDSYLVLNIPGKDLQYNFWNGTFYVLCDVEPAGLAHNNNFRMENWPDMIQKPYETCQYIESLACV